MRNAETALRKYAVYGVRGSLGTALLAELLARQHEVVAVVGELNALEAMPGLSAKPGDLYRAESVAISIAGSDGVLCCLADGPLPVGDRDLPPDTLVGALRALLAGLPKADTRRLLVIHEDASLDADCRSALLDSSLDWTLVQAPESAQVSLAQLRDPEHCAEAMRLRRFAAGVVDELERPQHLRAQVRFH